MKKTRIMALIVVCVMLALLFAACGTQETKTTSPGTDQNVDGETFKLACAVALTGGSAEQGTMTQRAMQLAIDDVNNAGGIDGKKVVLVSYDDRADPKEAATVANKIASDDSVLAVIGHTNSSCTLAGAPIYNQAGIVQITTTSSSPAISDAGAYTFRVWNSDKYTASFHAQYLVDRGFKKLGIIYENNDYGIGAYNVALDVFGAVDLKPLVAENYLLGETKDFTSILTKMKNEDVEAIFAVSDETELPMIMTQAHSLGYSPFVTSSGTYSQTVLDIGKEDVEGLYGATFFDPNNLPSEVAHYFEIYKEKYGETGVNAPAVSAYIATEMLLGALKEGAQTREEIKDYLTNLKDFPSMLGPMTFDENGDTTIPLTRMVIKDGAFVGVKD